MTDPLTDSAGVPPSDTPKRSDARRNQAAILAAAGRVFARSGVNAPVREVAAEAGVGMGTLYRHFPTRADLVVALYRHQVEECAEAALALLEQAESPFAALLAWVHQFVDFLGTKHGLGAVWQGDDAGFSALHQLFLDRLVPALAELFAAARASGELVADVRPYELLRAVGDLVAWAPDDPDYDVRRTVTLLVTGLRHELPTPRPPAPDPTSPPR
ncbi:MAG: TetR/AcrR family transcriptional regulator [Actinomycetales bacterium]|nr:TetR/AcrR family transcriptional regulator [Actinomycetales bacterium]